MALIRERGAEIDLTRGSIVPRVLRFSAPLVLGNLFQQLYNIVDASIIGRSCGVEALAAVSCTAWVCWLINALCRDSGNTFGIMGAVRVGKRDMDAFGRIVINAVLYTVFVSVAVTAFGLLGLRTILRLLQIPENILREAGQYLLIYTLCIPPMMIFNVAASLLRSVGNSRVTMTAMTVSTVVNIALDLLFILVFHWGVPGAAAATWISVVVSALVALNACRGQAVFRVRIRELRPDWKIMREMTDLLLPMLLNSVIISVGGLIVLSQSNRLGSSFTGGKSAEGKLFSMMEAVIMALQTGVSVFVGQNLGARQYERILDGLHRMLLVIFAVFLAMAAGVVLFLKPMLDLFLSHKDPQVYAEAFRVARTATLCTLGGMFAMTPMYIYRVTIQALGHAGYSAIAGFGQMLIRIATIYWGPSLIGIYAYYITDCMAWMISLPIVSIPCYIEIARLKRTKQGVGEDK